MSEKGIPHIQLYMHQLKLTDPNVQTVMVIRKINSQKTFSILLPPSKNRCISRGYNGNYICEVRVILIYMCP